MPEPTEDQRVLKCATPSTFIRYHDPKTDRVALGLDLATNCGYAYAVHRTPAAWEFNPWQMGVWDLAAGRYDTGGIIFLKLRRFLYEVNPALVFYEDVKYTPAEAITKFNAAQALARAATSAELIGALKMTLVAWCTDHKVDCTGVPIGTIKKLATGKGNANKELVIEACNQTFGTNFDPTAYKTTGADNVADAAWVLRTGLDEFGEAVIRNHKPVETVTVGPGPAEQRETF